MYQLNETTRQKILTREIAGYPEGHKADEIEKAIAKDLPSIAGLHEGLSDVERVAVFRSAAGESRAKFIAKNGDPFGEQSPPRKVAMTTQNKGAAVMGT